MSGSVTPWTVAHQAPPWGFPGKSTGVGCHLLLQGIFPTQVLNQGLLHCRQTLDHLSHQVYMRELIHPKMSAEAVSSVGKMALPKEFGPVHHTILFLSPRDSETPSSLEKTPMPVFFLFLFFCLVLILLKYLACVFLVSHLKFLPKNHKDIHRKTKNTVSG